MKRSIICFSGIILLVFGLASCASKSVSPRPVENPAAVENDLRMEDESISQKESKSMLMAEMYSAVSLAPSAPKAVQNSSQGLRQETSANTDEYNKITENEFKDATKEPLSTFSIDVDKASYANVRNYLNDGVLPSPDAVRIEELVNYFTYDYPEPKGKDPFSITTELADTPWNTKSKLFMIGIQGKKLDYQSMKPCNLVFLIDTSGSMSDENKLPLLKESLGLLVKNLSARDKIAIVAYAGSAGIVLDSTQASNSKKILDAMDELSSGGSTAGGEGIELAYQTAKKNFIPGGNNRVILCTDGDFNVGESSTGGLVGLITEKRKEDIYLTICGFGMGNYKDGRMEEISKAGNGNYFYIDSRKEAEKVFVKEMRANMFTIAKDVKIQLEFNPAVVQSYRLIGYENRLMAAEDFKDDTKDAGELGPGHTVTALYEVVLVGPPAASATVPANVTAAATSEMLKVKFRYKPIKSDVSIPIEISVGSESKKISQASENLRFASAVTEFGMLLRNSNFAGSATWASVLDLANGARGQDAEGYRSEFIDLTKIAQKLVRTQKQ